MSTPSASSNLTKIFYDSLATGNGDIYAISTTERGPTQLTSAPNFEMRPVVSPQGDTVAFTRENGGYQHIWVMHVNGSNPRQLTFGRIIEYVHAFGNDGKTIYTIRTLWRGRMLLPKRELFRITYDFTNTTVTRLGEASAISRDGRLFAKVEPIPEKQKPIIWVIDRETSKARKLCEGYSPAFTPNGKQIVYIDQTTDIRNQLKIINLDGSSTRELPTPAAPITDPEFTLDGTSLLIRTLDTERFGQGSVFFLDVRTSDLKLLLGPPDA